MVNFQISIVENQPDIDRNMTIYTENGPIYQYIHLNDSRGKEKEITTEYRVGRFICDKNHVNLHKR